MIGRADLGASLVGAIERNWPAFLVAAVCGGIALANGVRAAPAVGLSVCACCLVAAACVRGIRRFVLLSAGLAALGLAWGNARLASLEESPLTGRLGQPAAARVDVTSAPRRSRFTVRAFATVTRFDGEELRERVLLQLPPERAPPRGAVLEVRRAWAVEPRGPETGFDERTWLARRGVQVVLRASDMRIVGRRGGIGGVTDRLRAHVERTLGLAVSPERGSLLTGVVLGADEDIDPALRDAFRDSGLLHLMAVSGQNVAIIAGGVIGLVWLAGLSVLWGHAAAICVVLAYAAAVGWQPSVVRAAVAGCLVSLAWLTARPRDRWHALVLGALVLLAWLPASFLEAGFQLSFAAVAAIFVLVPRIQEWLEGYPVPTLVAQGGALAAGCSVVTAPIVLAHFGTVPVWAIPANVLAEGAMPPLLGLALAAAAIEPISGSAAAALVWLAGWCAAWLAWCARLFAGLPFATLGGSTAVVALAGVAAVGLAWRFMSSYRRRRIVVLTAGGLVATALWLVGFHADPRWEPPAGLRATFLDVGQGDSALLEVPGGSVLVDQGPPEGEVAAQLRGLGIRELSVLVLTHPQRDHIGGAAEVLRRMRVGVVLDPRLASPSSDHDAALDAAAARGVRVIEARAGNEYRVGRLRLTVLWPDSPGLPGDDPNRRALVLLATYGETDLMLAADAESDVTARLPLRAVEVLKVAHHGSEDPGLEPQLRTLRPRVAVISAGQNNDYGHPRAETLEALSSVRGLRLYRTDLNGRVVVESDGTTLSVRVER